MQVTGLDYNVMGGIQLALGTIQWRALGNKAMNCRVPKHINIFSTCLRALNFGGGLKFTEFVIRKNRNRKEV
jgi:hypothetical protein